MSVGGPGYRVRQGGLMRCCLHWLDLHMASRQVPPMEGDRFTCPTCRDEHGMVFRDGAWEWAKERV